MPEPAVDSSDRWPGWVYRDGEEPDYRFSFANERTFLAWIRTGLALVAAGVAVDALTLSMSSGIQAALATLLVLLGMLCGVVSWFRWARSERAQRSRRPLPAFGFGTLLAVSLVIVAVLVLASQG